MSTENILTRQESRQIDQAAIDELGLTGTLLMENAARGIADVTRQFFPDHSAAIIICGPGNNGGDGFAFARQLACCSDVRPEVWLLQTNKPLSEDAQFNHDVWKKAGGCVQLLEADGLRNSPGQRLAKFDRNALVFDCLLGTGISGAPREPFATAIEAINESAVRVLAVDVPSGLDCETGESPGATINADATVTFVAKKTGYETENGRRFTGTVHVAHIGLPTWWVSDWLIRYRASSGSDSDAAS